MHLLSIFWCRHLHCGLVVYRPAFMRDMGCSGPYFSRLLLNAIYFSASKHSPRTEIRKEMHDKATAGWSYRQRITQLLRDEHDKSSITTIQALLITASSLFSRCDERSASWLYAGNAFNMVIDLGLHVTPLAPPASRKLSEEDLEVRRRVFWGAFGMCIHFDLVLNMAMKLTTESEKCLKKYNASIRAGHRFSGYLMQTSALLSSMITKS